MTAWFQAVAAWWATVTASQATLLAAAGVGLIGSVTIAQKVRTDRRDQWWKRAQWAVDLTVVGNEYSQTVGWAALDNLTVEGGATRRDERLLLRIVDAALTLVPAVQEPPGPASVDEASDEEDADEHDGGVGAARVED